ncbi:MAG TPA: amidohydrolase family protein, partial [Marmoricola sp.]|nr:amidohydrolase family protein [Marmoricola sp.]
PFRSLQEAGARLAAGSDWSVSTPDPWAAIHVAVNRIPPEHPTDRAEAFLPEQRLSLAAAISAYTSGSAWVNHLDHLVGTIEVGKEADLVVVDRNPFTIKPDELSQTQVLQTFVAGRRVFAAED